MSEPKKKAAAPPPDLKTYAEIGDTVQYFPGGETSQPPWVGVVSRLGNGSAVTLNVISPDLKNMDVIEGVRSLNDKAVKAIEVSEMGGWLPRPLEYAVRQMLLTMGELVWTEGGRLVPKPAEPKLDAAKPAA